MKLVSLEKEFAKACKKHSNLKLLESQWRFDKELISKALQNISAIFPHYSRHDASHSKQIIVNIERLLGERIKHLTATDMWLILESAYSHDIGMVITHKQIEDLDSQGFSEFAKDITADKNHELHEFATEWLANKAQLPTGSNSHSFLNKYIQLISEWYRSKHPENSAKIIRNPYTEIGLDSPRNELLPKRLFDCLASICHAHGMNFDDTLKLPFSEAGMATEDCHPRFVAFLLRIGDLLDIDDNRFCPVMMRMCGDRLPTVSHAHYEKHRSIKHFRLDADRIEIEVACPSPASYEQAFQWFKWLEEEHHKISQNWNTIVPSKKLGKLATLSSPKVSIEPPYLTIEDGKQPKFKVNEDATLKLLRSTGLYSTKAESIREILQNAVDSSLIAAWIKHKDRIIKLTPEKQELQSIYKDFKITAELKQDNQDKEIFWLTVCDNGTGISEEDLRYMLEAGSSSKNKWKSRLIQEMPIWYRPSGNFGIGLQSIYLLSDSFSITTKSIFTHEALEVSFTASGNQSVVIKRVSSVDTEYGATVKARVKISGFPKTIKFERGVYGNSLTKTLNEYDFTREDSNLAGYEELKIIHAIHEFSAGSPIKISSNGTQIENDKENLFFSKKENILLYDVNFGILNNTCMTLFRGQEFDGLSSRTELFSCTVDFYSHQASEFLSYNREKILPHAKIDAEESMRRAVIEYIESRFNEIPETQKPAAAAFHFLYNDEQLLKYKSELFNLVIPLHNNSITLSKIISDIESLTINQIEKFDINSPKKQPPNGENVILLDRNSGSSTTQIITALLREINIFWQEDIGYSNSYNSINISKIDIQPVSDKIFSKKILRGGNKFDVGNRMLFPVWGEFRDLALEVKVPWARVYWRDGLEDEFMVLPCKFGLDNDTIIEEDEVLINWAYKNRKKKEVSKNTFHEKYLKLISHLTLIKEGNF
jgi:hypothetical protein